MKLFFDRLLAENLMRAMMYQWTDDLEQDRKMADILVDTAAVLNVPYAGLKQVVRQGDPKAVTVWLKTQGIDFMWDFRIYLQRKQKETL